MQNSLIIDPSRPTFFPLPSDNKLDSRAYLETTFFRGQKILLEKKKNCEQLSGLANIFV